MPNFAPGIKDNKALRGAKTCNEPGRFFLWCCNSSFFSLFLSISSFVFLNFLTEYSIVEETIVKLVVGPLMFVLDSGQERCYWLC